MPRIAFVTGRRWPVLSLGDRDAANALEARGLAVETVFWDDPKVPWEGFDLIVPRSCWDYFLRPAEFIGWLDGLESVGARILNPVPTIRWNFDKMYLADLERRGVAIVPSEFPGSGARLADLMDARGWSTAVLKPRVSGSGHRTHRVARAGAEALQYEMDVMVRTTGAVVQEFAEEVPTQGEITLIFFAGRYSHGVLKRTAPGEFRVQSVHGGSVTPFHPGDEAVAQAQAALDAVPHSWVYARVDGVVREGRLVLMEIELIEPALFLEYAEEAPVRFAEVLIENLPRQDRL